MEKKNVRLDQGKRDGVDAARPTTASAFVTKLKNLFCAFCKGNHEHHDCKEITSIGQRKQLARMVVAIYTCERVTFLGNVIQIFLARVVTGNIIFLFVTTLGTHQTQRGLARVQPCM